MAVRTKKQQVVDQIDNKLQPVQEPSLKITIPNYQQRLDEALERMQTMYVWIVEQEMKREKATEWLNNWSENKSDELRPFHPAWSATMDKWRKLDSDILFVQFWLNSVTVFRSMKWLHTLKLLPNPDKQQRNEQLFHVDGVNMTTVDADVTVNSWLPEELAWEMVKHLFVDNKENS